MNLHKTIKLVGGSLVIAITMVVTLLAPTGTASADFSGCRNSGDPSNNTTIGIQGGAVGAHNLVPNIVPPYTPIAGDEIAVFNTSGQCAGKITHTPASNNILTAWGGADGMAPGEAMEFRIWDSVNDRFFVMNVTISPNNSYVANSSYLISGGTPTAVTLANIGVNTAVSPSIILILLLFVVGTIAVLQISRHRQPVK